MPRKKAVLPTPEEAIQLLLNAELNGRTVLELALDSASYSFNDLRAQLKAPSSEILDSAGITLMPMYDEYTELEYYVIKLCFPKQLASRLPDLKQAALVVYDYCWGITLDGKPFDIYAEREGAKNLSVNYIYRQGHLAKRDDGGGQVVEGNEAAFELFIANQQLAEAVEPTVGDLNNPAAGTLGGMAFERLGFLSAPLHVRDVAMRQDALHRRRAPVAGIGTEVLRAPFRRCRALDLDGLEHRLQLRDIMPVRAGHDER